MAYQCNKCAHSAFHTVEQFKNHSRIHASKCTVRFPIEGHGAPEEITLYRCPTMQCFVCSRCLSFHSKLLAKMQQHCKTCKEKNLDSLVLPLAIHPDIPDNSNKDAYITAELGFFVNEELHIAICQACEHWVDVGSIMYHATRNHRYKKEIEWLVMDIEHFQLEQGAYNLRQYCKPTSTLKDPIEGLPVVDGYMCTLCIFYTPKLNTLKAHLLHNHKEGNYSIEDCSRSCSLQQLSLCPTLNSWFGVSTPLPIPTEDGPNSLLLDIITREAIEREEEILAAPYKDPRQLPLFMKKLHLDHFIESMNQDVVEMAPLLALHEVGDARFFPNRVQEVCRSLMVDFQSTIATTESLLRRKVRSTNTSDISTLPFSRLEQSCEDYVGTLVHLLMILFRSLDSENVGYNKGDVRRKLVPLDGQVQQSLQCLWNKLQTMNGDGQFANDQLEECKLDCIQVLEALFFQKQSSYLVLETSLLVFRFVLFAAIQHTRVLAPDDVTHRISVMMYWCRSLVLHKIIHTPLVSKDEVDKIEAESLLYVHEDQRTPFAAILEAKRLIFAITNNEAALPKVIWVGDAQIVDGTIVGIDHVSMLVHDSIQELYKELKDNLLLGMPEYNSNKDRILRNKCGGLLEDNLYDDRNGEWFMSNKNNCCSSYTLSLILHIARTTSLRSQFINSVGVEGTREIVWNRDALSKWMRTVGRWLQKLMTIIHLVAGQPARGVEFLACSTRNTPTQIRGVYFVDGLVMLLTIYGKGDNIRGSQLPIARFLCKDTSFLLINYLIYVREMEIVASKVLYGLDKTYLYNHLLAVKGGRPMSSRDLSEGISSVFLKHQKASITLASWRHMAIAWMHRFLKYTNILELTSNSAIDSQASHSQRVASKCYARSNFDHPNIGRDEFQLYRLVSVEWHRILRLVSDSTLPNLDTIMRIEAPLSSTTSMHTLGRESSCDQSQVSTTTTTNIHHHHHHEIKVVHSQGDIGIGYPSLTCSEQALSGLVALGYTKFKSSYQANAIYRILERQEDLLVVLPTGGGKTLLFLLPALVEHGRYTTIVICPFVALRNEMEHRARDANISMQVYSESIGLGEVDILLASVEHCMLPTFQSHLAHLHAQGRLGRIVLDECHVALTASSWRPILTDMQHVRKVPVPLLLLSATVPPDMEDSLKRFFNSQFSVIRSPTTRPNLSYEVRKDQGELDASLLAVLALGPMTPKSIIFSRGREETVTLVAMLRSHGFTAVHYHGKLDQEAKNTSHNAWASGEADIMVATGAFGTGIDLGAVRLVVHMNEPYSMIDLAQESGRGGRDGSSSKHVILLPQLGQAGTCTKMVEYLSGTKCRRWVLQGYIDGQGLDCFSSGSKRCDVCESKVGQLQSRLTTATWPEVATAESFHESQCMDLFTSPNQGGTLDMQKDPEPPSKRICTGNALLSRSATETRERHADVLLTTLSLVEYLSGVKDKCIVCNIGQYNALDRGHVLLKCPYLRDLCFKCLGHGHGSKECQNKLCFRGLGCYGCGLPRKLGAQVMHTQTFGGGCKSMGNDKLIPACWYMWRNAAQFHKFFIKAGCPPDLTDIQFAEWLTDPHETYVTNILALFISYVMHERL